MDLLKRAIDGQLSDLQQLLGMSDVKVSDHDDNSMTTALHHAAWYNKCDAVDLLIKNGADVHCRDADGAQPLHYAARHKTQFHASDKAEEQNLSGKRVIRSLVKAGCHVNDRDVYGDTPLFFAVLRGNMEAVEELLACEGVDVESADNRQWTALHAAAKYHRVEIGEMLVKTGAKIRCRSDRQVTPIMLASGEGDIEFVKMLLKYSRGTETELFNDANVEDETALDLAVEQRRYEMVKICLEYGARVRKTCRDSRMCPLHIAASVGDAEICELLLQKDKQLVHTRTDCLDTALHLAAEYKRPEVVQLLIEWEANLEAEDKDKDTPLLTAVEYGSPVCTKVLLDNASNIRATNKLDQNALHVAAKYNEVETMKVLLAHVKKFGLEEELVSADDRVGNGPLHLAAQKGYLEIIKLLLDHGADVKDKNEDEEIPLHVAAENGYPEVVSILIERSTHSSIINEVDEDTNTPLHLACAKGHVKVVQRLLYAGADVFHRNRMFWTPLACAVDGGHSEVVKVLLEMTAEVDPKDRHNMTPLHLAARKGHVGVTKILMDHHAQLSVTDDKGNNPMDTAIKYGQEGVAMAIAESKHWKDALKNRTPGRSHFENHSTPLRQLIRRMPDVAERVFDQCITYPKDADLKDPDLEIEFDFEFLDDTYSAACWGDSRFVKIKNVSKKVYNSDGTVLKDAPPYTDNNVSRVENHPLNIMVDAKKSELLYHPLVLALVRQKWRLAQISYFSFLIFYATFVSIFTSYMVLSKPPYFFNTTIIEYLGLSECEDAGLADMRPDLTNINIYLRGFFTMVIWVMSGLGIATEVVQLYTTPTSYLTAFTNILDWFTYISASLVVAPVGPCDIRTHWQWQLGSMCMFVAWIDLILFLRRLPGVGIYIVMVGEVFITFIKFFAVCFSLFIFAFGFTFYVLLRNQETFYTPPYSFAKTVVMMVGEMDFGDIFHGGNDLDTLVAYETLTHALFIIFVSMCTIVIMNLLTGLAVGDVQVIQDQAKMKKLAMQIELSMDVEMSLIESFRKKFKCTISRCTMQPNQMTCSFLHRLGRYFNGPLSSQRIAAAIFKDMEKQLKHDFLFLGDEDDDDGKAASAALKKQIIAQVTENREKLHDIGQKVDNIEHMLTMLIARRTSVLPSVTEETSEA